MAINTNLAQITGSINEEGVTMQSTFMISDMHFGHKNIIILYFVP